MYSAELAKLAYRHHTDVPRNYLFIKSPSNCHAYVWRETHTLYMTFRGTITKDDMIANIDIRTHNLKDNIKIHHGFYKQFISVESSIKDCIDMNSNVTNVHIVGHSRGGSIGNIASVYFAELYPHLKFSCHTFGSPRVGNREFINWFSTHVKDHIRVVNKFDPITTLPYGSLWEGLPNCLQLDETSSKFIDDEIWYKGISLYEHDIDLYINRLKRNLQS